MFMLLVVFLASLKLICFSTVSLSWMPMAFASSCAKFQAEPEIGSIWKSISFLTIRTFFRLPFSWTLKHMDTSFLRKILAETLGKAVRGFSGRPNHLEAVARAAIPIGAGQSADRMKKLAPNPQRFRVDQVVAHMNTLY